MLSSSSPTKEEGEVAKVTSNTAQKPTSEEGRKTTPTVSNTFKESISANEEKKTIAEGPEKESSNGDRKEEEKETKEVEKKRKEVTSDKVETNENSEGRERKLKRLTGELLAKMTEIIVFQNHT